ncbi:MAG TPA: AraC family transcriptional regulator [Flavisolibacter sp.]|jgi:AraC-like DNA-binding protein|nr:AraC family transcriptional regulator [Flavisolibacter sp.]
MSDPPTIQLSHFEKEQVTRACAWMATHLAENPGLRSAAGIAGLSTKKFKAGIRLLYNQNFAAYLLTLRKEKARSLLLETNALVAEVGRQCGFRNEAAFHRWFKQWFGQTPGVFRKGRVV